MKKVRTFLYIMLEGDPEKKWPSFFFDIFLVTLILLNVLAIVLGSVESVLAKYHNILHSFEGFSVIAFTIEYVLRVYSITINPKYSHPVKGRIRFALRPLMIVDLLSFLPFYGFLFGHDLRFLRILRLLRLVRIFKLVRYMKAARIIANVIRSRSEELIISFVVIIFMIVISSCLIFYAEHKAQPEVFDSIPDALWWSVTTLTTVGYGDIVPITFWGKVISSFLIILGIAMLAIPSGILASGFYSEMRRESGEIKCPHCGKKFTRDV